MNTVMDLFSYAKDHDIRLHIKGREIVIDAPENEITERFLKSAKKHKQEIIGIIVARDFGAAKQINVACRGLSLKSSQFAALCTEKDLQLIGEGKFSPESLHGYAESFDEGVKSGRIEIPITRNADINHNDTNIENIAKGVGRWNPELAKDGYVWCFDCKFWDNKSCAHPDNPFRSQCPQAPRKCHWYERKHLERSN